jgi:hypothetical protein
LEAPLPVTRDTADLVKAPNGLLDRARGQPTPNRQDPRRMPHDRLANAGPSVSNGRAEIACLAAVETSDTTIFPCVIFSHGRTQSELRGALPHGGRRLPAISALAVRDGMRKN